MSPTPPDYSTWLTKQQAADRIGVTTKSIERFVQAGQVQQARWQRDGRGPLLAVYFPDDVDRIAAERQPGPPAPFLVPGRTADRPPANGNERQTPRDGLARSTETGIVPLQDLGTSEPFLRALVTTIAQAMSQTSQTSALFLTVDEAAAYAGLTARDVRRAVRTGELPARHKERANWRTWRIRRKDLEQL